MTITPPEGSKISVLTTDIVAPTILIPAAASATRNIYAAFLMAFQVVWLVILNSTITRFLTLVSKLPEKLGFTVFTGAWLVAWIAGGLMAAWQIVQTLRPAVPASLRLAREGIDFDSGIEPPSFSTQMRKGNTLSDYFPRRIRRRIDLGQLKSLRTREFENGTRLTVDVGNERIKIARGATEVEREWLFRLIVDRYQLKREA